MYCLTDTKPVSFVISLYFNREIVSLVEIPLTAPRRGVKRDRSSSGACMYSVQPDLAESPVSGCVVSPRMCAPLKAPKHLSILVTSWFPDLQEPSPELLTMLSLLPDLPSAPRIANITWC